MHASLIKLNVPTDALEERCNFSVFVQEKGELGEARSWHNSQGMKRICSLLDFAESEESPLEFGLHQILEELKQEWPSLDYSFLWIIGKRLGRLLLAHGKMEEPKCFLSPLLSKIETITNFIDGAKLRISAAILVKGLGQSDWSERLLKEAEDLIDRDGTLTKSRKRRIHESILMARLEMNQTGEALSQALSLDPTIGVVRILARFSLNRQEVVLLQAMRTTIERMSTISKSQEKFLSSLVLIETLIKWGKCDQVWDEVYKIKKDIQNIPGRGWQEFVFLRLCNILCQFGFTKEALWVLEERLFGEKILLTEEERMIAKDFGSQAIGPSRTGIDHVAESLGKPDIKRRDEILLWLPQGKWEEALKLSEELSTPLNRFHIYIEILKQGSNLISNRDKQEWLEEMAWSCYENELRDTEYRAEAMGKWVTLLFSRGNVEQAMSWILEAYYHAIQLKNETMQLYAIRQITDEFSEFATEERMRIVLEKQRVGWVTKQILIRIVLWAKQEEDLLPIIRILQDEVKEVAIKADVFKTILVFYNRVRIPFFQKRAGVVNEN